MATAVELKLAALHTGDNVTIIDRMGARMAGSVVGAVEGDPDRTLKLRRVGGTISYIPYDRVREIEE
jgi:hypothetical protein